MNTFFKCLLKLLKIFLLIIIILAALGGILAASMPKSSLQVQIFILYSGFAALTAFFYMFLDLKLHNTIIFIFIIVIYMFMIDYLPDVKYNMNLDTCIDNGICAENLEVNTEYGKIIINAQTCIKYGWSWNEEKMFCDLR